MAAERHPVLTAAEKIRRNVRALCAEICRFAARGEVPAELVHDAAEQNADACYLDGGNPC